MNIEEMRDISLKEFTTLHIGGICRHCYFPKTEEEIFYLLDHTDPLILGCGSNVLINDETVLENALILTKFNRIRKEGNTIVADAGARLMDVCLFALELELTGMEFAYGIPGSVGGGIMMNAGAYGGEMIDIIKSVKTTVKDYTKEQCEFGYRHSVFSDSKECILQGTFQLKKGNRNLIAMKMKELIEKRIEKQPLESYSAGSTFKRGQDFYASQLISECGLKGYRVNDAQVSMKHAGFLINNGHSSYRDFMQLIEDVQRKVFEMTGKKLECEVKIIGGKDDLRK